VGNVDPEKAAGRITVGIAIIVIWSVLILLAGSLAVWAIPLHQNWQIEHRTAEALQEQFGKTWVLLSMYRNVKAGSLLVLAVGVWLGSTLTPAAGGGAHRALSWVVRLLVSGFAAYAIFLAVLLYSVVEQPSDLSRYLSYLYRGLSMLCLLAGCAFVANASRQARASTLAVLSVLVALFGIAVHFFGLGLADQVVGASVAQSDLLVFGTMKGVIRQVMHASVLVAGICVLLASRRRLAEASIGTFHA